MIPENMTPLVDRLFSAKEPGKIVLNCDGGKAKKIRVQTVRKFFNADDLHGHLDELGRDRVSANIELEPDNRGGVTAVVDRFVYRGR
jgi:hypothetical protein